MNYPIDLKYSKSHEWIRYEDGVAIIGISDFAQDALGDVVFVNLPAVGDEVTAGEAFGDVETVELGFAPGSAEGWEISDLREEDCHFFVRGGAFDEFEALRLRIPSLAHA